MSRASSPSSGRRYGTARVCQLWEVPRSTVYARRARASRPAQPAAKRGPKGAGTDAALTEQIRAVLARSPFMGEGYRKAWARLRLAGVRTSKGRVLRLMRAAGLLAPTRVGRRRGPRNHDGTITTDRPDELRGTDATACLTTREGNATVFIAVDHCTQECVGIHAARPGTRFEALEPLRHGLRAHHGGYGPGVAAGLSLRHDHGSQYLSDHFQGELRFLGIRSSPSFVAAPEGNGCAERFIRTLKEQLLWVEPFETVQQSAPRAARVQGPLQPEVAGRAPRPPHPGRRPPGTLAEHRSGCMITASEVSKKPGAVQFPRQPHAGSTWALPIREQLARLRAATRPRAASGASYRMPAEDTFVSIEHLTGNNASEPVVPESTDDWLGWVSATRTRNHVLGDPLLDWLDLHGALKGFKRDDELPGYDPRMDFTEFLFSQGRAFEEAVVAHLRTLHPVMTISDGPEDVRALAKAAETFRAMRDGTPIIHQGVLRDPQHRSYGAPDILVRCDVLAELFPGTIEAEEATDTAPDLGGPWHYRVVDIKFTTLHLSARGELANQGSSPAYKLQLYAYNRALGRLQGYEPPTAYLLGRGWEQQKERGFSCMERLAPIPQAGTIANGKAISEAEVEAARWVRRVRSEGSTWDVLPQPTLSALYPNSSNRQDGPWHTAKMRIAEKLEDLTLLWQVGERGRRLGHEAGVYRWTDPACTPEKVGVTGDKRPHTLQRILEIDRSSDGPPVQPARIRTAEQEWRENPPLEFYVDFETVNDLADDFSRIPQRGGQPLIFMIGCGHAEDGEWVFASFTANSLTEPEEARIIDEWLAYMLAVRDRQWPDGDEPRVIHWSPAEVVTFESAYNAAKERHPERDWPSPRWFDLLGEVMREEPVVVRGAFGFGLKAIAKAMHGHGLIDTLWDDGPADGLGAMVGAWWCQDQGVPLTDLELMSEIVEYNEVDCRVMMEAVRYLRAAH